MWLCDSAVLCFVAGKGAMEDVSTIVGVVTQYLPDEQSQKLSTSHCAADNSGAKDEH